MPMTGAALTGLLQPEIKSQLQALLDPAVVDVARLDKFATALANALGPKIVDYIKANAVVTVTGVQNGGGSAPGTVA